MERVIGLDALRFVAALWVFLFHWGVLVDHDRLQGAYGSIFCGPAAVIVFFIISGFCIHYPYRNGDKEVHVLPFLARRYLRVGLPLFVAMLLTRGYNITVASLISAVGWSILIELIFYSIYPFLRIPLERRAWLEFFLCFFVLGFLVVVWRGNPPDYAKWGHQYNWLLALPCWLLGCRLATWKIPVVQPSRVLVRIWFWRLAVWGASVFCCQLRYHAHIGLPWSLNLFAFLVYFWIQEELKLQRRNRFSRFLDWGGKWSYSLYLMHPFGLEICRNMKSPFLGTIPDTLLTAVVVLALCYVFYLLVEKPSHWLARWSARLLEKLYPAAAPK